MTSILKVDTIQDADGNNIINENSNTITIGASGDTTNIIGTLQNNGAAVGLAECSFRAYQNSAQVINNATSSQINLDTEDWDTDNAFASSTFTCPADKTGKYLVVGAVRADTSWSSTDQFNVAIFRNGASNTGGMSSSSIRAGVGNSGISVSIIDMAAGDTLKLYLYHNEGGSEGLQPGQESTYLAGTRITE